MMLYCIMYLHRITTSHYLQPETVYNSHKTQLNSTMSWRPYAPVMGTRLGERNTFGVNNRRETMMLEKQLKSEAKAQGNEGSMNGTVSERSFAMTDDDGQTAAGGHKRSDHQGDFFSRAPGEWSTHRTSRANNSSLTLSHEPEVKKSDDRDISRVTQGSLGAGLCPQDDNFVGIDTKRCLN